MNVAGSNLDTFPKLLIDHARTRGDKPSIREKQFGIWQAWTWLEVAEEIKALACGLAAMGLTRGDKIAIVGDNRPRLYWTMTAAQAIGAIPVPVYQDSVAEEMSYVIEHAEVRFAMVEDQEQVDKLTEIRESCPRLEQIIYDDARGLRDYSEDSLSNFEAVQERGRAFADEHPDFYDAEVAKSVGSDTAIMLYTSGTTGRPKGVVLSFDNVLQTAKNSVTFEGLTADEEVLAYLPMAWVGDNIFSFGQSYAAGFCVSCPESGDTVMHDLRELGPSYFFAPPRIFENILTSVLIRMEDASSLKRKMFRYFMDVAKRCGIAILNGEPVSFSDRILYALGNVLIYGPLKNVLGFSRIRLAYTAGEAIGPDIFDFYRSLGINLKQLYGSTEASVFITIQPDGEIKADTVGKPAPGVDIKIADSGEVLFRGPGVFVEYYKNPEATAETKTDDGWVHTGDAGFFADDGHLKIIDRAKDVGRLNSGALMAPKYVENKLKFFPDIKEAVAFGHDQDFCAAFINIDLVAVGNWAERNNIAYASYQELAENPDVSKTITAHVEQVNRDLASDPNLSGAQIKRFLILHKELDADDGELTRTQKVRRSFIADRYAPLVEGLYGGSKTVDIETEVTFEDGRKGMIKANLQIIDAETYATTEPLKQAS
ncbi:AMP-binding protein [Pelagibius sp. Alg239-R121]|uniref:AMP-binding protein n=1 Tax=Pelagibius sp. Alg239-R121 TaxID=2993448 RepID=UPI0024A6407C|nr:AMP-binding protein [Pelagibius sp. Alg239-R121]